MLLLSVEKRGGNSLVAASPPALPACLGPQQSLTLLLFRQTQVLPEWRQRGFYIILSVQMLRESNKGHTKVRHKLLRSDLLRMLGVALMEDLPFLLPRT